MDLEKDDGNDHREENNTGAAQNDEEFVEIMDGLQITDDYNLPWGQPGFKCNSIAKTMIGGTTINYCTNEDFETMIKENQHIWKRVPEAKNTTILTKLKLLRPNVLPGDYMSRIGGKMATIKYGNEKYYILTNDWEMFAKELSKTQRIGFDAQEYDEPELYVVEAAADGLNLAILLNFYAETYDGHFRFGSQGRFNVYIDDEEYRFSPDTFTVGHNTCKCAIGGCDALIKFIWINHEFLFRRFNHSEKLAPPVVYNDLQDVPCGVAARNVQPGIRQDVARDANFVVLTTEHQLTAKHQLKLHGIQDPETKFRFRHGSDRVLEDKTIMQYYQCAHYEFGCQARGYIRMQEANGEKMVAFLGSHNHTLYTCDEINCNEEFQFQNELIRHVQIDHSSAQIHECVDCGKKFSTMNNLKLHIKTHTKPYKCTSCGKGFSSNRELNIHTSSYHTGNFQCKNCTFKFKTAKDLKSHRNKAH